MAGGLISAFVFQVHEWATTFGDAFAAGER
jgi:hypothetical protein